MSLKNHKVVVTGGPTREWLDPVRFISNPSSGKMGAALADEAHRRSGETVFLHGPVHKDILSGKPYRCIPVETTEDLLAAVTAELADRTILIMAAAPADYTAAKPSGKKIKKNGSLISVELKRTPDILKTVARMKKEGRFSGLFTVGFAAETDNLESYALQKLDEKDLDMICLNDVSQSSIGFGADMNVVTIFNRDGTKVSLPILPKEDVAARILDLVEEQLPN